MNRRLFRCSICNTVSDSCIETNNKETSKGHFYKDPKHPRTSLICTPCNIEIGTMISEFHLADDPQFNYDFTKRKD